MKQWKSNVCSNHMENIAYGFQLVLHGIVIRLKRIYNFWCSMLILHHLLRVLLTLRDVFMRFPELTYWQDATVPVSYLLLFCVSEKLHRKYSWNWIKRRPKLLFFPDEGRGPKESRRGARRQPHHEGARPSPWSRPPVVRPPWSTPDDAPSPIKSLPTENPKSIGVFPRTVLQLRRHHRRILGDRILCSGTLPGWGSAPGAIFIGLHRHLRHLHRRCCLRWWWGSSSPPELRALPVAMWFTSLSHDVIFMWSWALYLVKLVDAVIQILCYYCALYL
jgi:hypothetical protein